MTSGIERGTRDLLTTLIEQIGVLQQNVGALLAGGTVPAVFGASESEINTTGSYGVVLNQIDGSPVPANRIQAGQHEIFVYHEGTPDTVEQVGPLGPPTISEGRVWFSISWVVAIVPFVRAGDVFEIRFPGIVITNEDGTLHRLPTQYFWGRLTELATVASNVTAIKADLETGPNALAQIRSDIGTVDTVVDRIEVDTTAIEADTQDLQNSLAHASNGLAAIKSAVTTVDTQTDILADGTNGLAAIKTAVNGRAIPADITSKLNTAVNASNVPTAKSLQDVLHKDTNYAYDKATDSLEAISDKVTVVDTQTDILADAANGNAAIKTVVADVQTKVSDGTNGLSAIKTAVNQRATPTDVLAQAKAALNTAVNGSNVPTAKSVLNILHKDANYTFDASTDSLEALRDFVAAVQGGAHTIEDIYTALGGQASTADRMYFRDQGLRDLNLTANVEFTLKDVSWSAGKQVSRFYGAQIANEAGYSTFAGSITLKCYVWAMLSQVWVMDKTLTAAEINSRKRVWIPGDGIAPYPVAAFVPCGGYKITIKSTSNEYIEDLQFVCIDNGVA